MIRAVFFDLDGTLIDSTSAWRRCIVDYMDRHSLVCEPERRANFARDISDLLKSTFIERRNVADCLSLAFRDRGLSVDGINDELAARFPTFFDPDPAVLGLLENLSKRYKTAIVTNGSRRVQRAKIERAGLSNAVGRILISGELGVRKPEPGIFLRALAWAEVGPDEAMMVGNDPYDDITGAQKVGMRTCEVRPDDRPPVVLADWTIGHVTELAGILG